MEAFEAIRQRRAVRDYKSDQVPTALLRELIDAASWAPSANNGQTWRFVVITDRDLISEISNHSKRWVLDNEASLVTNDVLRSLLNDPQYNIFHSAPALILIATPILARWNTEACALAAENMMLAATALGLGSCWIGLAEDWLNTVAGHKAVQLAETDHVVAPITIGFPRGLLQPVARNVPKIIWLGETKMVDDGESGKPLTSPGFYGSLIHP